MYEGQMNRAVVVRSMSERLMAARSESATAQHNGNFIWLRTSELTFEELIESEAAQL